MVYVDKARHQFGRMKMCHMIADSLVELHAMADKLGLKRSWFQNQKTPHYDICQTKRMIAVVNGAVEMDRNKTVELIKDWRLRNASVQHSRQRQADVDRS